MVAEKERLDLEVMRVGIGRMTAIGCGGIRVIIFLLSFVGRTPRFSLWFSHKFSTDSISPHQTYQ